MESGGPESQKAYSNELRIIELEQQVRHHAALAIFGQTALAETSVASLLNEIVILAARVLNVEYAEVLELLPDRRQLVQCAGIGWMQTVTTLSLVTASKDTLPGFTILSEIPVVFQDLSTETRFKGSPALYEHHVISGISVQIYGKNRPFGVLGVYTSKRHDFTKEEVYFLQTASNMLATALKRLYTEQTVLESKERLQWVAQATNDVYWDWDCLTGELWWNDAVETFLGYTMQEAGSTIESRNERIHPEDRERIVSGINTVIQSGRDRWSDEYRFARADNSYAHILDRAFVIRNQESQPVRMVGAMADITKFRKDATICEP